MLLCPAPREQLMQLVPKGGEGLEIGVAQGEFSRVLLDAIKPRKLHLIDPWEHQTREDYNTDGNNVDDASQESRYRAVAARFAKEIGEGRVVMHRAYSQDIADEFADGQFDWIYIDGLHSYDGVCSDLEHYKSKLKPGGILMGHDYTNHQRAQQMQFGVVQAVNEFVAREGFTFLTLTQEIFPTYMLTRDINDETAQHVIAHLLYHVPGVVELRDFPAGASSYLHKIIEVGDQLRLVSSF
jgi:SAM-dependent methyltransferase